jgi:hypothetical protein
MDPVRGTYCLELRRLPSCSDMATCVDMVCFVRIWCVPSEAWRTDSPCRNRQPRQRACDLHRARCRRFASRPLTGGEGPRRVVQHQDTSDRLLPPNLPIYLHPRSSISSYLSSPGLSRSRGGSRDTTFHDVVARFGRTARSGPRVFAEVASCRRASDIPVARSCSRAALSDDCALALEPRPP